MNPRRPADKDSPKQPAKGGFPLRRRFLSLPTMLSFAIAGSFIFFLLKRFNLDVPTTWGYIQRSNPLLYLAAFVCYYASFPIRGLRWGTLLENCGAFEEAGSSRPSAVSLGEMVLLGWFTNSTLWFRLGDAYRAYVVSERNRVGFTLAIATVAAERLLDLVSMSALLLVASLGVIATGSAGYETRAVVVAAVALSAAGLLVLLVMKVFGTRIQRFLPRPVQPIYARFQAGTLGSFRRLPLLGVQSMAGWLLEAARLYFVVAALGLHVSPYWVLMAALGVSMLTTIPLTPGGLGFAEAGLTALLALSPDLTHGQAVAATVLDRSITYLSVVVIGALDFGVRAITRPQGPSSQAALGAGKGTEGSS